MRRTRVYFFAVAAITSMIIASGVIAAPRASSPVQRAQAGRSTMEAEKPNFSGTWRLDAEASDVVSPHGLAGLGGSAPENLYITHARNGALILSSRINGAQPRQYTIGGENALPAPGGEDARMTIGSRWQGSSLVNEGSGEFEGDPFIVREVMSLGADGGSLRLEITSTIATVTTTNTLVYEKAGS